MNKRFIGPSAMAAQIIRDLRIREPSEISIKDIAMNRGAFVRESILEGSEARLIRKGRKGIVTVNSGIREDGRKRFAIAHELGHFELHSTSQLIFCTEEDMLFWNEGKSQEIEANEFSACILMPEEMFSKRIKTGPPNLKNVRDIAEQFRTTLTATALRYCQLSPEPCAVVVSRNGVIRWYRKSDSFDFHVKVGEKLSPDTYAYDFFDGVDLPSSPQKAPATAWLAGNVDEGAEIFEHSIALASYNVVLSMLWIYEEIRLRSATYYDDEPEFDLTNPFTPDGKRWRW
ncbi:MAG: ImmA/IrrE family metallo-endopeptidase [Deltaproteobacteria bacterium]|nr:ImmA/IrrE family metallo-endopeptidase [Deltaproteobacteria bacterium]